MNDNTCLAFSLSPSSAYASSWVLSSMNNSCNTGCTLSHSYLPQSTHASVIHYFCLEPSCFHLPGPSWGGLASYLLGKVDLLYFALKLSLSTFKGSHLPKHPRICRISLCSPSVLLRTNIPVSQPMSVQNKEPEFLSCTKWKRKILLSAWDVTRVTEELSLYSIY